MVLGTKNLSKTYIIGETEVRALINADISIGRGEAVAIVGSSGSGKSTLLHLIGGIDRPTEGKVFIENEDIYTHDDETLALLRRRRIGFVFQMYNLMPQLNVYENVVLPLGLDGRIVDKPRVEMLLDNLGLAEKHKSLPSQLSGGQQQRVAIARALVTQPAILLCDEPTGNLDSKTGVEVLNLLRASSAKLGQTMAIITHDEKVAHFCDRVLRIEDGMVRGGLNMKLSVLARKNVRQSKSTIFMIALAVMLICAVINLGVSAQHAIIDELLETVGDNHARYGKITDEQVEMISQRREIALADLQLVPNIRGVPANEKKPK